MTEGRYLLKGLTLPDGSKSEIEIRDGKISLWRDYFDKQAIIDVMTPPAG